MATRILSPGDSSVTELINRNVYKNDRKYTTLYQNDYIKKSETNHRNYLNGHVLTSSSDEEFRNLKDKCLNGTCKLLKEEKVSKESFEKPNLLTYILANISFYILMLIGFISYTFFPRKALKEYNRKDYPRLVNKFSSFYSKYVYRRIRDCWNYPVCSVAGAEVVLKDRITKDNGWTFEYTGLKRKCINLGSYNYLGFANTTGPCTEYAIECMHKYGYSVGTTRDNYGTYDIHRELERLTADFLGVEDAITCGMGFATNASNIPTLLSTGCLVLSDEKNHASLILGMRLSGATIKVFQHNDMADLEKLLQSNIYYGQPNQPNNEYKPWKKIFIFVEGIYSMEGTIVKLPQVIALKKKYKTYLYLDEAHSIGAIGRTGRGVVEYFDCDPNDVDILMGTFTKSFASAGGYIAGSKELISYLRQHSYASKYACAMSPPIAAQIIAVLKVLMGRDGTDIGKRKIEALARNRKYFRQRLAQIGFIIYGCEDSPVVPILVYLYSKIAMCVRTLIQNNVATVGVGYPATPLLEGRIRICLSATHTKEQLDYSLQQLEAVANNIGLKHSRLPKNLNPIVYERIKVY
ncbi:hypothetical protein FQA39_LY10275 [Lamprigera yunnana]|nr:hypothetical protein FQA39_LY10275 [Lamprigera yunnana]